MKRGFRICLGFFIFIVDVGIEALTGCININIFRRKVTHIETVAYVKYEYFG